MIERGEGDRLTMRNLAEELGIQAPSLYKHFPDKESITTAIHVDYLAGQLAALEAALAVIAPSFVAAPSGSGIRAAAGGRGPARRPPRQPGGRCASWM